MCKACVHCLEHNCIVCGALSTTKKLSKFLEVEKTRSSYRGMSCKAETAPGVKTVWGNAKGGPGSHQPSSKLIHVGLSHHDGSYRRRRRIRHALVSKHDCSCVSGKQGPGKALASTRRSNPSADKETQPELRSRMQ